jgi:hypothetical protein
VPIAAGELGDDRWAHGTVGCCKVECIECLELREARVVEPVTNRGLVARSLLGGQDLVEIVLMCPVILARLPPELLVGCPKSWHLEISRLRHDELLGDRCAAHRPPPRSQSS